MMYPLLYLVERLNKLRHTFDLAVPAAVTRQSSSGWYMVVATLVRTGEYRDSVELMLLARQLSQLAGVDTVSVLMGTPANKALLARAGLSSAESEHAAPDDLVISIRAADDSTAAATIQQAQSMLARQSPSDGTPAGSANPVRPRTVRSAARQNPDANLAVISVPGEYGAAQAWDALRAGLHVLLFSDHVSLRDEIALKKYARDHDLWMMGPGAGTAIINGIGLGFANSVPRGPIGIASAAGTGLQHVSSLIARAGAGISQGIGTGGRDVGAEVGGIMLHRALDALEADPGTRVIVVISKLPSPAVTDEIIARVRESSKPTVLALMTSKNGQDFAPGAHPDTQSPVWAQDLEHAAALAVALARGEPAEQVARELAERDRALAGSAAALRELLQPSQRYVCGLYSGGTLCEEAMRLWQPLLGDIWSNAPLNPAYRLPDSNESRFHTALDMGEEEFTLGRPHPMIDNSLRVERLLQQARDASVAVIVLDVVLGYGAHPDPASELAPAIAQARETARREGRELIVVASVTGTDDDPQGLTRQTAALEQAGARVMPSNAAAVKFAAYVISSLPV